MTMAVANSTDLADYCRQAARRAKAAAAELAQASGAQKNAWLRQSAARLRERSADLLEANAADIAAAPGFGLTDAQIDRLRLTPKRIDDIAVGLEEVAALPDPVGEVIESSVRPNGLQILKARVPLGVVFFIYESRPNVTADAAAICVKSGNAVILRGGKEAAHSSRAIVDVLHETRGRSTACRPTRCSWSTRPTATAVGHFLRADRVHRPGDSPRRREPDPPRRRRSEDAGDQALHRQLPRLCRSRRPTWTMAERIMVNAKCQRLGVCNAGESLLVHARRRRRVPAAHRPRRC